MRSASARSAIVRATRNTRWNARALRPSRSTALRTRLAPLDDPGLPAFIARGALPDPATARCELCDARPGQPLSTVLVVDGPDGLPVPFLVCGRCRRTLHELRTLLESASRPGA